MTHDIPQEVVEELVSFVREFGEFSRGWPHWAERARTLAAKLPPPVDPDIEEARKLAAKRYPLSADMILAGKSDATEEVQGYLVGIKRGRALQSGEA